MVALAAFRSYESDFLCFFPARQTLVQNPHPLPRYDTKSFEMVRGGAVSATTARAAVAAPSSACIFAVGILVGACVVAGKVTASYPEVSHAVVHSIYLHVATRTRFLAYTPAATTCCFRLLLRNALALFPSTPLSLLSQDPLL